MLSSSYQRFTSSLFVPLFLWGLHLLAGQSQALEVVDAARDTLVSVSTSATAVPASEAPRLIPTITNSPYVAVVRFPVQAGAKYTLLNVYPANDEDDLKLRITGYYPLSADTQKEQGASGSLSGGRSKSGTDTGQYGHRYNFSISPTSQGKYLYVVYFSKAPRESFQLQLSSNPLPDQEVLQNKNSPYTKRVGPTWGDTMGEFWSVKLADEPPPKTTLGGGRKDDGKPDPGNDHPPGTLPGDSKNLPQGITVQAEKRRAKSGETVTVPVLLLNGKDVANLNVVIHYDSRVAKATAKPEEGAIYESLPATLFESNSAESDVVRFGHATTGQLDGTGVLANVTFRAIGRAGTRSTLRVQVTSANDFNGNSLKVATIDGEIVIEPEGEVMTGDTDNDGVVTVEDARNALKMSVKLIPEDLVCDVDKDGTVTSNDARILLNGATASTKNRN